MHKEQQYPPPSTIAIDVDGTLIISGEVNRPLVAWAAVQKARGYKLMLWSARGEQHAERAAQLVEQACHLPQFFDAVVSKPGYVIDDLGWTWVRYTRVITSLAAVLPKVDAPFPLVAQKEAT